MSRKTGTVDYYHQGHGMITTLDTNEKVYVHESDIIKPSDGSFKSLNVGQTVEYEIEKQQQSNVRILSVGQTIKYEMVKGTDDGRRNKASKVTAPGGVPLVGGFDDDEFCFRCCKNGHRARDCVSEDGHGGGGGH